MAFHQVHPACAYLLHPPPQQKKSSWEVNPCHAIQGYNLAVGVAHTSHWEHVLMSRSHQLHTSHTSIGCVACGAQQVEQSRTTRMMAGGRHSWQAVFIGAFSAQLQP